MNESPKLPRGIRNNNPLNIRRSANPWKGKIQNPTDPAFEQFETINLGIRAAFCNIRTYICRDHINTPRSIIRRWAPAEDNNDPAIYCKRVCARSGLRPDEPIRFAEADKMIRLVWAMAEVECGILLDIALFRSAYALV